MLGTPDRGILEGVTRRIVLEIAKTSNLFAEVYDKTFTANRRILMWGVGETECFITSTTRGVHPVESIFDPASGLHHFKTGPDTFTARLQKLFLDYREACFRKHGA